jgi:hypothetical protein
MTMSLTTMTEHIQQGTALPLFPEGAPGPVQYDGQWWAIATGETDYRPVTDPDTVAQLDGNVTRLHRARDAARAAEPPDEGGSS